MSFCSVGTEEFTGSTGFLQRTYGSPSPEVRVQFSAGTEMFSPQVREIGPRLGHFFSAGTGVFHRRYGGDLLGPPGQERRLPRLTSRGSSEFPWGSVRPGGITAVVARGIPYKYLCKSDIAPPFLSKRSADETLPGDYNRLRCIKLASTFQSRYGIARRSRIYAQPADQLDQDP